MVSHLSRNIQSFYDVTTQDLAFESIIYVVHGINHSQRGMKRGTCVFHVCVVCVCMCASVYMYECPWHSYSQGAPPCNYSLFSSLEKHSNESLRLCILMFN